MKFISIIISAYNIEDYIQECLESCRNQQDISQDEFEVIVVDDGSTDQTSTIAQKWAADYKNFIYIYKENGGLSTARNEGLKYAQGEFIWWIDGDDIISDKAISVLKYHVESFKVDSFIIDYFEFKRQRELFTNKCFILPKMIFKPADLVVANQSLMPMMSWLSVFRRDFLIRHRLLFLKNIIHEDMDFSVRAFSLCKTSFHISTALYGYRIGRRGSIMNEAPSNLRSLQSYIKIEKYWHEWFAGFKINNRYINTVFSIIDKYILFNPDFKSYRKTCPEIDSIGYRRRAWVGNWKSKTKMALYTILPIKTFNELYRLKLSIWKREKKTSRK